MEELDVEAAREKIAHILGDDEVYDLVHTFRGRGAEGDVTVEVWYCPGYGYTVHSRSEGEHQAPPSNPNPDPLAAIDDAHLYSYQPRD